MRAARRAAEAPEEAEEACRRRAAEEQLLMLGCIRAHAAAPAVAVRPLRVRNSTDSHTCMYLSCMCRGRYVSSAGSVPLFEA